MDEKGIKENLWTTLLCWVVVLRFTVLQFCNFMRILRNYSAVLFSLTKDSTSEVKETIRWWEELLFFERAINGPLRLS